MIEEKDDEFEIDLLELFNLLKRKIAIILIATLFGAIVGFTGSKFFMTPMYESSINMIVNTRNEGATNVTNDNITSAQKMVSTYAIILKSNTVLNKVISNLNLDTTYNQLKQQITVSSVDSTQVMRISMQDADPAKAHKVIKQISTIAPDIIVNAVEAGSCKVISEIEDSNGPVSPSVKKYTAIGGLLMLVATCGIIVLKELFSNYIEDEIDVEKKLGLPVLGIIPEVEEKE